MTAGRKHKYGEETIARQYRIPVSVDKRLRELANQRKQSATELIVAPLRRPMASKPRPGFR